MVPNNRYFIDSSAGYTLMDRSDRCHNTAAELWQYFIKSDAQMLTSNYIVLETLALLQHRLGFKAADLWYRDILGIVDVIWVERNIHDLAYELWLSLGRRRLSFVDCVSFVVMRQNGIEAVFGFDVHFAEQGFIIRP